jgi:hypothetical protein
MNWRLFVTRRAAAQTAADPEAPPVLGAGKPAEFEA